MFQTLDAFTTVVIARYNPRSKVPLKRLLRQLETCRAKVILVENDDALNKTIIEFKNDNLLKIKRPNIGMNIGAWESATGFIETPFIVYLQDECQLIDENAVNKIETLLAARGESTLFGESINPKWCGSWDELATSKVNTLVQLDDETMTTVVDFYKQKMLDWSIDPGTTGRHLRTLVLAMSKGLKKKLGAFPAGKTKLECIAAEIAISRKADSLGIAVDQFSETPFSFFSHPEWRSDGMCKHEDSSFNSLRL